MTNAQRRARAQKALDAVKPLDNGGDVTDVCDLIADLLHLADYIHQGEGHTDLIGEWAAEHAAWHYREEVDEETAEQVAMAEAA